MNPIKFSGSIVALITPMYENGEIDFNSLKSLVEWHVASGTSAIVAVGTTGESPVLSDDETLEVVRTVVETANGRIPVLAGNGSCATDKTLALTAKLNTLGIDGFLCVTPYYNKPSQEGLYQHYLKVAQTAANTPVVLYNVPGRTAVDLLPETVIRLAEIPNIIAIKEATGDLDRFRELKSLLGDKIGLLSGDDHSCCDFILEGGDGVISVTANVKPDIMAQLCQLALSGQMQKAHELNDLLADLHRDLFVEANPIPVKWSLNQMNRCHNGIRLPLTELDKKYHQQLTNALSKAGINL